MKIACVYIVPPDSETSAAYAARFLDSYHAFPPGEDHETVIVLNSTKRSCQIECLFSSMPHLYFLEHDNSGFDIGGFQLASRTVPCELMIFFGVSAYFRHPNWLVKITDAFQRCGPAQYGAMGNAGDPRFGVQPHIRTTAFWLPPILFNRYPIRVNCSQQRHPFEHGPQCLTTWLKGQGIESWVVSAIGEHPLAHCDKFPGGFHRGTQHNLLMGDRLSEPPFYPFR